MRFIDLIVFLSLHTDHKEAHRDAAASVVLSQFYGLELGWIHLIGKVAKLPGGMGKLFSEPVHIIAAVGPIGLGGRDNGHVVSLDHLDEIVVPDVARVSPQAACVVEGNGSYLAALDHAVQVLLALPINPLA